VSVLLLQELKPNLDEPVNNKSQKTNHNQYCYSADQADSSKPGERNHQGFRPKLHDAVMEGLDCAYFAA